MGIIPGQPVDLYTVTIQVGSALPNVEAIETSQTKAEQTATEMMTQIRNTVGPNVAVNHSISKFKVDVAR